MLTADTAPGLDGVPYGFWRGGSELADGVWHLMDRVGAGAPRGRPREFGISLMTMVLKSDLAFEGDAASVQLPSVRPLTCGSADTHIYGVALNLAYADDLALVLRELRAGLSRLLPIFRRWSVVSGLCLRADKGIIVPLCERGHARVQSDTDAVGDVVADMAIKGCAKFLGVVMGPEAPLSQWDSVLPRILPRAKDVYRTGRGLGARLAPFRSHVVSLVVFKLHFVPESLGHAAVLRQALQRLTGAP